MPRRDVRILFSEGSSTNAREMITTLGLSGYRVELCDPNPPLPRTDVPVRSPRPPVPGLGG